METQTRADATRADARDDVVYSNLAYILPALFAPTWVAQAVLSLTGAALVGSSAVYHATYTREGQSLDVSAMMTYVASLACAVAAQQAVWAWAVLPVAAVGYWAYPWRIDSYTHVPVWAGVALVMLAVQAGWWGLPAAVLFIGGGAIKLAQPGRDAILHSLWHLLGGASGAAAMWVL
jgi:hypothetical protein